MSDLTTKPEVGYSDAAGRRHLTDLGNAERLADQFDGHLIHVYGPGWYAWDGKRWAYAERGEEVRAAKQMVRSIYGEAEQVSRVASRSDDDDEAERKKASRVGGELLKHAKRSESGRAIDAAVKLARSDERLAATPTDLNIDPNALNVKNGILDLKTLEHRPHDPAERHTRITNAAYEPGAVGEVWERFLERILPDEEIRRFVQKAAGLSLTGRHSEHLFIPWGDGRNGKSTTLDALRYAVGDYGMVPPDSLLLKSGKFGQSAGDLSGRAKLMGVRLVMMTEVEEGSHLDESFVKQLTGEHTLNAKLMRQDTFEFENQTSIWLSTNHKPKIRGTDLAIWERIHLIPFDQYIPKAERIEDLGQQLKAEADAILAWMVEGLRAYYKEGLTPPADIVAATQKYKSEMNPMNEWISTCDLSNPKAPAPARYVRASYEQRCQQMGAEPLSPRDFNKELEKRGFEKKNARAHGEQAKCWIGLVPEDWWHFRYLEHHMGYSYG